MKEEKITESFYTLLSYLMEELIIKSSDFEKGNFKIWQNLGHFFHEKFFV
jgi:SET domain-containing protein